MISLTNIHRLLNVLLLVPVFTFAQKEKPPIPSNPKIVEAHEQSVKRNREEAIKQSLQLLSTERNLNTKDSIYVLNILAENLYQIGNFQSALEYALESKSLSNPKPRAMGYRSLMKYYHGAEAYDKSLEIMKQNAAFMLTELPHKNHSRLSFVYNDIGYTHYLNNEKDSAEHYYLKVLALDSIQQKNIAGYGLSIGNLGQLYYEKGQFEKALEHFKIDAYLTKNAIWQSHNNATYSKAQCYYQLQNYSLAEKELKHLLAQKRVYNLNKKLAYLLMSKIKEKQNQSKQGLIWLKAYTNLNDSLIKSEKPNISLMNQLSQSRVEIIEKDLALSENMIQLQESQLHIAKNKEEAQQLKMRNYLIFSITLGLFIIMGFAFYNGRQKRNNAIIHLEKALLESEVENKKRDLSNFGTNLSYKREFIEDVQLQLTSILNQPKDTWQTELGKIIREFNNYQNSDEQLKLLQSDIEKVNVSFFKKLTTHFPLLTQNERELCSLFVLKLSSKDIAIIRNVSPNAIKKARQRIRKKLPINKNEEISEFLERLPQ